MRNAGAAPGDYIRQSYTFKDKNYQNFLSIILRVPDFCHPLRRRADSRSGELSGREQKGLWKRKAQNEKQTALVKSSLLLACCKFEDGLEINFIFKEFSRFALDLAGNCSVAANLHGF